MKAKKKLAKLYVLFVLFQGNFFGFGKKAGGQKRLSHTWRNCCIKPPKSSISLPTINVILFSRCFTFSAMNWYGDCRYNMLLSNFLKQLQI